MEDNKEIRFLEENDKFTYESMQENTPENNRARAEILLGLISSIKTLDNSNSILDEMHIKRIIYDPQYSYRNEYSLSGVILKDEKPLIIEGTLVIDEGYHIYSNLYDSKFERKYDDYKREAIDQFFYSETTKSFTRISKQNLMDKNIEQKNISLSDIVDFTKKINLGEKKGYH